MHQCPVCSGKKEHTAFVNTGIDSSHHYVEVRSCGRCKGSGFVSKAVIDDIERGKKLRADRVAKGLSFRDLALSEGVSVSVISRRELGIF